MDHSISLQSTIALLSLLEYEERDLNSRTSAAAHPEHVVSSAGNADDGSSRRTLTVEEKIHMDRFVRECAIDRFLYHADTNFHTDSFAAPSGYAATFHRDTTFSPEVMEGSFRIFASCSVEKDGRFRDDEIQRWKSALNATIPDQSPDPPIYGKHSVKDAWVPSLGAISWIGIGDCIHSIQGPKPRCVYVVCGLDPGTLSHLSKEFYSLRKGSYEDAQPCIQWCRGIVRENARRLLYMAVTYMGLPTKAEIHLLSDSLYPQRNVKEWERQWFTACGIDDVSAVYAGIHIPAAPRDCPPPHPDNNNNDDNNDDNNNNDNDEGDKVVLEESVGRDDADDLCLTTLFSATSDDDSQRDGNANGNDDDGDSRLSFDRYPRSLVPEVEVYVSDLIEYPHVPDHLLRLSDMCALHNKVVRVAGPDDDVYIYEVKRADPSEILQTAIWLHSFPGSGAPRYTGTAPIRKPYLDSTWLDPKVAMSPYLAEWSFGDGFRSDPTLQGIDISRGVITIQPQLVRVTGHIPVSLISLPSQH